MKTTFGATFSHHIVHARHIWCHINKGRYRTDYITHQYHEQLFVYVWDKPNMYGAWRRSIETSFFGIELYDGICFAFFHVCNCKISA